MRFRLLFALALLLLASGLSAQPSADLERYAHRQHEVIYDYVVDIDVQADGELEVTERITVQALGRNIQRGIYRDFPTRYRDRYGNRVNVAFSMLSAQLDNKAVAWRQESVDKGVRIYLGDGQMLPVPAQYTYEMRYRTNWQVGFFENHDEVYFNAIGHSWVFPILQAQVNVRLPAAVPATDLLAECFTGMQGAVERACQAQVQEGQTTWKLTRSLNRNEGMTVVLAFPKGVVAAPSQAAKIKRFLYDNLGILVGLLGFLLWLGWCMWRWWQHGRDPAKGVIYPRYEAPQQYGPAMLRYVQRRSTDATVMVADLLALAVGGRLKIDKRARRIGKPVWQLHPLPATQGTPIDAFTEEQQVLYHALFAQKATAQPVQVLKSLFQTAKPMDDAQLAMVEISQSSQQLLNRAMYAHASKINERAKKRYYQHNVGEILLAGALALGVLIASMVLAANVLFVVILAVVLLFCWVCFAYLIGKPTDKGRALMDEIEGFKLYMSVAERDELAAQTGMQDAPEMTSQHYQALLPYAVALGIENKWSDKFTAAVGAAAAMQAASSMAWAPADFSVSSFASRSGGGLGSMVSAMSSDMSSSMASASTPPSSSSGSSFGGGGGGSSGGGGGGGGGGGW